jgi:hypothetical protein
MDSGIGGHEETQAQRQHGADDDASEAGCNLP